MDLDLGELKEKYKGKRVSRKQLEEESRLSGAKASEEEEEEEEEEDD